MSDLTQGERMRAAIRADQELALTEAAFDGLRIAMVNELIATNYDEGAAREHLYHGLRALRDVRLTLQKAIKDGTNDKALQDYAAELARAGQSQLRVV